MRNSPAIHPEEPAMCPACLTTLALTVGTASSAGGVAALLLRRLYLLRNHRNPSRVSRPKEKSP
jgi:hypothetical protein